MITSEEEYRPTNLHGRDAAWLTVWLEQGLRAYYLDGAGARAFPGAESEIRRYESLSDELAAVAERLDGPTSVAFQEAIAKCLERRDFSFDNEWNAIETLLFLAQAVRSVDVLPVIKTKAFRFERNVYKRIVFRACVSTSIALAPFDSENGWSALISLTKQQDFMTRDLAEDVLTALAEISPNRLPEAVSATLRYLSPYYSGAEEDVCDSISVGERFADLITTLEEVGVDQALALEQAARLTVSGHGMVPDEESFEKISDLVLNEVLGEEEPLPNITVIDLVAEFPDLFLPTASSASIAEAERNAHLIGSTRTKERLADIFQAVQDFTHDIGSPGSGLENEVENSSLKTRTEWYAT